MHLPAVTVIVPCRNENRYVEQCLRSIVENDYPAELLQVLVIDGMSTDGSVDTVRRLAEAHAVITMLENPRRVTPSALNIGIARARGEFILWMSAHNRYDRDYIRTCVEWALRTGADNVGGIIVTQPRDATLLGRTIAGVLSHPVGVGGSRFRTSTAEPEWVDTVFGGCYRRSVFDRIGNFNERLVRGQDFEFNMRLKRAGMKTLLVPRIRSVYHARSRLIEFLKHNWTNGEWVLLPFKYSDVIPVSMRHLVPLGFILALVGASLAAVLLPGFRWLPFVILIPYSAAILVAAGHLAHRHRDYSMGFIAPFVFVGLHFSYGFGALWGLSRSLGAFVRHMVGRPPAPWGLD